MSNSASVSPEAQGASSILSGGVLPFVISHLGGPRASKWVSRAIVAYTVGNWIWNHIKPAHPLANCTTIFISSNQKMYDWTLRWISAQIIKFEGSEYTIELSESMNGRNDISCEVPCLVGEKPSGEQSQAHSLVPRGSFTVAWRNTEIIIDRPKKDASEGEGNNNRYAMETIRIDFLTQDKTLVEDWIQEVTEFSKQPQAKQRPWVYVWQWGWNRIRHCPESRNVVLPDGVYQSLQSDLENFLQNQAWYESVGIPWRRGYLLHGLPGTGKSTTVQTLAAHFGLNIYCLSLAQINDDDLRRAISDCRGGIMLIEDVDCAFDGRQRDEASQLTMSGLLNAIDGAATPDGQIIFLTTNHVDRLDPALYRPGRVDFQIEFGYATRSQISALAKRFGYGSTRANQLARAWEKENLTMAKVQERLINLRKSTL